MDALRQAAPDFLAPQSPRLGAVGHDTATGARPLPSTRPKRPQPLQCPLEPHDVFQRAHLRQLWLADRLRPRRCDRRLRIIGLLRRDPDPAEDLLRVLFVEAAPRMTCPLCKEKRLHAADHEPDEFDDGDWQAAVLCEVCRQPIPEERVEALPGVKRCVACQGGANPASPIEEPEYCPRCGAIVEIRASRGSGITRYRRFCTGNPPCRL